MSWSSPARAAEGGQDAVWKIPSPIKDDVRSLLKACAKPGHMDPDLLKSAWQKIAGKELCQRTRLVGFREGTLTIAVKSSALYYELQGFRGEALRSALVQALPPGKLLAVRYIPR